MKLRLKSLTACLLSATLLAACGGGDDGGMVYTPPPPTASYSITPLVADGSGAAHGDANLVNAWGIAFNPQAYVWVANAGSSTSTLYDGDGVPQSLVVSIPAGQSGSANPTGIVFNASSTDFMVSQGGITAASPFIFVTEGGTVAGWSPSVNRSSAITAYDGGASNDSYKGATLASVAGASYLHVADFHHAVVSSFDAGFNKVTLSGGFVDPALPAGYAPFGIQAIGNLIYVAYAKQDALAEDEIAGPGLGLINVFDSSGTLVKRLATGGALNAPWGIAMAPADFGPYSGSWLVGNFGDGKINAYNPSTGQYLGALSKADGSPLVIDGLWGIAFGNGMHNQPVNTLFFAAGPGGESHGLYGRIDVK